MGKRIPSQSSLNRKMERLLGAKTWENSFCDDFTRDVSLEERARKNQENQGSVLNKENSITIGYFVKREGESYFIKKSDHEILYDKECEGCIIYNEETGMQKIVSQKEFEEAFFRNN